MAAACGGKKKVWVVDVEKKLDEADASVEVSRWQRHCIYRVPACIKDLKPKAYKPQVVSLGPFHHGDPELLPMEEHKRRALRHLLRRAKKPLEEFVFAVEEVADQLASAYLDLGSEWREGEGRERFVEMMIVDGCFLLEVMRAAGLDAIGKKTEDYAPNDPIFSHHGVLYMVPYIRRDMLILENQLPLLLLEKLVAVETSKPPTRSTNDGAGAIIVFTDEDVSSDRLSSFVADNNYAVHTFGLGTMNNLKALRELASKSPGGTYSFVHEDKMITPALAVCVGGLMKVVVPAGTSKLTLTAEGSVTITDTKYDLYRAPSGTDRSKTIEIDSLQAGETKKILVFLKVPAAATIDGTAGSSRLCSAKPTKLLTATFTRGPTDQVITHEVCVDRPNGRVPVIQAPPSRLVVEQIVRIELIKVIKRIRDSNEGVSVPALWSSWNNFVKDYKYWSGIDVVLGDLQAQIDAMAKYNGKHSSSYWASYISSWISSHETQRPTAIGSSSNVVNVFITEQVNIMVHLAVYFTENEIDYQGDCGKVNCVDVKNLAELISKAIDETKTTVCANDDAPNRTLLKHDV